MFKDKKNIADFITGALPDDIVSTFDLKSVKINDSNYIDENLKNHLSDLVIKLNTKNGQKTDIYILFEHKSYIPKNIIWQLLKYQYLMLEEDFRSGRKFRIILPVVFYHGKRKWKLEKSFGELTKVPEELQKYVLNFEYMFYDTKDFDLSQEKKFGKNVYLLSAMSLMKNIHGNDPEQFVNFIKYVKKTALWE